MAVSSSSVGERSQLLGCLIPPSYGESPTIPSLMATRPPALGSWVRGEETIRVVREAERLTFSSSRETTSRQLRLRFYNMELASDLIRLFRGVIQTNLERLGDHVTESAFLPVLFSDAWAVREGKYTPTSLQVGLFGDTTIVHDPDGGSKRVVIWARWGVYNRLNRSAHQFELGDTSEAAGPFLKHDVLVGPASPTYSSYVRSFKVIVTYGEEERITSIALRRFSQLDHKVLLDEQNWAITLVSYKPAPARSDVPRDRAGIGSGSEFSHAMIASEGIKGDKPFLKYSHIRRIDTPSASDGSEQAEVHTFERSIFDLPLRTLNGPTISVPRAKVEQMLTQLTEAERKHEYVSFELARGFVRFCVTDRTGWKGCLLNHGCMGFCLPWVIASLVTIISSVSVCKFETLESVDASNNTAEIKIKNETICGITFLVSAAISSMLALCAVFYSQKIARRHNCASWAIEQVEQAGIEVKVPRRKISPQAIVRYLKSNPNKMRLIPGTTT